MQGWQEGSQTQMCLGRRMKCHEVVSLSLLQTLGERAGSLENIFKESRERSRKTPQKVHMLEILCCLGSWKGMKTASGGQDLPDPSAQGKEKLELKNELYYLL